MFRIDQGHNAEHVQEFWAFGQNHRVEPQGREQEHDDGDEVEMFRHNEVYQTYGSRDGALRQFRIAPPSLLSMTTGDVISLYKFFSVNTTVLFGEMVLPNVRKAGNEQDEDREMHEQATQAHERFADPKCHAEIEGQDSII